MTDQMPPLPPLPPPQQDIGKRWIRIDLDLIKKTVTVSGHVYDKNLAINMLADALKTINNIATVPITTGNGKPEGHA